MQGKDMVDIIVLNYNQQKLTADCINSINYFRDSTKERIILIDNGSTTFEPFGKHTFLDTRDAFVTLDKNYGCARGWNVGIAMSRHGADIIIINNDTIVTKGWIKEMQAARDAVIADNKVGVIVPMTQRTCRGFLNHTQAHPEKPPFRIDTTVPAVCWYILRDALDDVGHFDERYEFGCGEDFDYCNELSAAGYQMWGAPGAFVRHVGSQTVKTIPMGDWHRRNDALYQKKWGRSW